MVKRRSSDRSGSARQREDVVVGGPHAVAAALRGGLPTTVQVYVERGPGRAEVLAEEARGLGIAVKVVPRGECDRLAETRAQGIAARLTIDYADLAPLLAKPAGLLLFLDGVEDPHNLGAIVRTAEAVGALGVVIPVRRSARLTSTVVRVSAGAALELPVCRVPNLVRSLDTARNAGFWLLGLDAGASRLLVPQGAETRFGLVVGAEGRGLGRLVREHCDELVRLPMTGRVGSLNASVATAVAIYRACQDRLFRS